jgi:putative heme-binding domain-containing protein
MGMPAFRSLGNRGIQAVVEYVRLLQGVGKTVKVTGDPERGKALFSGKAGCSECHMVAGSGGFIASDLTGFARTHSAEEVRSAITNPVSANQQARTAVVTTVTGEKHVGRIRNEDNFSLQLQTLDGTFHFLSKASVSSVEYQPQPLMPSNYGSTLTSEELNDLIAFLISSAGGTGRKAAEEFEW